jgi:hypothetical protein
MFSTQKWAAILAATGALAVIALAYAAYLSPSMILSLADLRLCI